jgi:flagellar basal body rod protein FlgG
MDTALISGAHSLKCLENWQTQIAHNLANASTAGFQKNTFEITSMRVPEIARTENGHESITYLPMGSTMRPNIHGEVKVSDNPYDLAIIGNGYFSVEGPGGMTLYTRDGEFHRNMDGILVSKMGYPLLSEGGTIEIRPEDGPFTVAPDGTVSQNGQVVDRIAVYDFANPEMLQRGNGSYILDPDNRGGVRLMEDGRIAQGQLEMSTVSPLTEMVTMIQVSRAYEMSQKFIQQDDDRYSKVIETFRS